MVNSDYTSGIGHISRRDTSFQSGTTFDSKKSDDRIDYDTISLDDTKYDFHQLRLIKLRKFTGEIVPFRSILNPGGRTMIIFLKRFQRDDEGTSYHSLQRLLYVALSTENLRVVFITCHHTWFEVRQFIRGFARYMRRVYTPEGLQLLTTQIYQDVTRDSYRFFGLSNAVESWTSLKIAIGQRSKIKETDQNLPTSLFGLIKTYLTSMYKKMIKAKDTQEIIQVPGICVFEDDLLVYQCIMSNQSSAPQAGRISVAEQMSPMSIRNSVGVPSALPESTDQEEATGESALPPVSHHPGSAGGAHSTTYKSNKLLTFGDKIGQGRESDVLVGDFQGTKVAIKVFRRSPHISGPSAAFMSSYMSAANQSSYLSTGLGVEIAKRTGYMSNNKGYVSGIGIKLSANQEKGVQKAEKLRKFDMLDTANTFSIEVSNLLALTHKNIVQMVCWGAYESQQIIVLHFEERGSLFDLLSKGEILSENRKRHILREIANGIEFLHSRKPPIVHQDLKSMNVLVGGDWAVRISDFGISQAEYQKKKKRASAKKVNPETGSIHGTNQITTRDTTMRKNKERAEVPLSGGGTLQWMAPEVISGKVVRAHRSADIFSFGVICWEVATRKKPWRLVNSRVVAESVVSGSRLVKESHWKPAFTSLVDWCWHENHKQRPSIASVKRKLEGVPIPVRGLDAEASGVSDTPASKSRETLN